MKKILQKTMTAVADYVIPSHCFNCSRSVENGNVICDDCYKEIELTKDNVCDKCGIKKSVCDCKRYVYHFSAVAAPFRNDGIAKKGLYGVKFNSDEAVVDFYVHHMVDRLKARMKDLDFDFVTFVPMSPIKKISRGFNQAELLANGVAKLMKLTFRSDLLYRSIFSPTQHRCKNVKDRFINAYKSYHHRKKLKGGRVLLIDDIKTTGASLEACSRELLMAGADEVFCLVALIGDKNS